MNINPAEQLPLLREIRVVNLPAILQDVLATPGRAFGRRCA
jgi:hypothetical protein